jgi:Glycosyl transferase family 2
MSAPTRAAIESTGEPSPAAELSIIVPTFNERDNIGPLIERLSAALTGVDWQATFVDDDSPDGTWQEVRRWTGASAVFAASAGAACPARCSRARCRARARMSR